MEIKKRHIVPILLILSTYDEATQKPVSGLLFENIGMGLRRKLQKISKWLQGEYKEFQQEYKDAEKAENHEDEIKILLDEVVKSDLDYAMLSEIEKIDTKVNYDFELIEMIAK